MELMGTHFMWTIKYKVKKNNKPVYLSVKVFGHCVATETSN